MGTKKRKNDDGSFKRKKLKAKNFVDSDLNDPIPKVEDTSSEDLTAEILNGQTIREGMLLLGCVTKLKPTFFVMSLPGYLTGIVQANNISDAFTKSVSSFANNSSTEEMEPSIDSMIKVGMVFPCKVIQVSKDITKGRPRITLSINPQDVNTELKPSSLYSKMVLFVSVCSVEDHGYIVDVGSKYIQGFLPKKHFEDNEFLRIGEVIPAFVKKVISSEKLSAKIQLSKLDFNEDFPEVSSEDIKLSSLLPGARIRVDVIEVKHPFVYMKYLCFDACASILSLGKTHKSIKVGSTVLGTVVYIHPITHMIYVMLSLKPSPNIYAGYFGLKKFECVQNLKFECFYKNRAYFKINKGTYGFINTKDLPDKGHGISSGANNISKACIVSFHYMDNLIQLTAKPSMLEQTIISPEDVQIGDIYEAIVKKHVEDGMFVYLCPGLHGFIRLIQMSDVFVTKPESLHPIGSKVKCRVLSTDGKGKLNLTCKESLVNLEERYILSSYENAQTGQFYKGVIVKKSDKYILVLFFNEVKGIVHQIPKGSVFYVGQIVLCEILQSIPSKKKLTLSLDTRKWCSIEELDDVWNDMMESSGNKKGKKSIQTLTTKNPKNDSKKTKGLKKGETLFPKEESKINITVESNSHGPVQAIVKKVKGDQLNIMVNKSRGRVHITQLGCVQEGVHPLRKFTPGQKISVYVIGEHKKKNFLKITYKNIYLKECSLNVPSVSLSQDLECNSSIIGFVKEVGDVSAILWLSSTETGVLDYLHFSENPKVVKKVQRYLKVGMSLRVSVLDNQMHSEKGNSSYRIMLTKIERKHPEVGKNILGLVQIGCIERGLILKLPFGYHGVAAITDVSDVYIPGKSMLDKCRRSKFVLCHVLEVNHQTKYCQVSLRKSRLYNKKITKDNTFCPEILPSNIKEGDTVKGFVITVSNSTLNVIFGRNLEGKVSLHNCSITDCSACSMTKSVLAKYPVGSVIDVDIEKMDAGGKSCILNLFNSRRLDNSSCNRLSIKEDISWEEVE